MKKVLILNIFFIVTLLITPISYLYAESNSGFLNDTIWYSQKTFVEGDTIEIHTAVWNGEDSTLSAKVEFTDLNTVLGSRNVSVPAGTLQDVFITWKVTAGDHTVKATIKDATLKVNGKSISITLPDYEQALPKIYIAKKSIATDNITKVITEKVEDTLPENVAKPISSGIKSLDSFRVNTDERINSLIDTTNKKLEILNSASNEKVETNDTKKTDEKASTVKVIQPKTNNIKTVDAKKEGTNTNEVKSDTNKKPLSGTEKPIAYVELFLLKIASFIFNSAIVFYLVCLFLVFIIIRFIYKKIRG
ncbi:hypothetical protein IT400_03690 [Candidatus Nomurabacteria bacterium]|nr:hypothetical protein [Candidatus Nomurabacteria bacterium]